MDVVGREAGGSEKHPCPGAGGRKGAVEEEGEGAGGASALHRDWSPPPAHATAL